MESNQDQHSPPSPTGHGCWFFCLPRKKVIPYNNEEETIQQLQPERDSEMEKRQRKLEEGSRQQDRETQMSTRKKTRQEFERDPSTEEMMGGNEMQKKIIDLKKKLQQQKRELQRCIEKDEALKRELEEKTEILSRKRMEYKKAKEREAELRRGLEMMKERIPQREQKREDESKYLEQIDFVHVFNVLTVQKCREQMDMQMQSEETLHHTVEKRAFIDGNEETTDQKQDEPREQERLNGGALSPEQPKPSTSSLAEPTTPFNVSDSEENECASQVSQSFEESEAEEPASETPKNTDEKCENSPRPEQSAFKWFSRFRLPKIRMPKLTFKKGKIRPE
ncbi:hypothetical protein MHYP_G00332630 [Metynnis hypsauchen]